jgi:hypothetical protein
MSKWVKIFCLINIFTGPRQNGQNFVFNVFLAKIFSCRSNRGSLVYRDGWLSVESRAGGFFGYGPLVGSYLVACGCILL